MNTLRLALIALSCSCVAQADFSYTQTRKGGPTSAAVDSSTKHYYKGQRMKSEGATSSTIMDFDGQTITTINHSMKTYTVTKFSELGQTLKSSGVQPQVDVRQTGQKRNINGYNASEVVMTMSVDSPETARANMKMVIEMTMWLSPDVPGTQELRAFYKNNIDKFPWAAMTGGGANPAMQKAMADLQKKIAELGGVPLLQVMKMRAAGDEAQMAQMQQGMARAQAQLEEMRKQGGAQAQAAEQALARMGMMGRGGGSLFEITMESTGFSTAPVPDSVFAIPAGYQKK